MKKICAFFIILSLALPLCAQNAANAKPAVKNLPKIYLFESPYCGACTRLLRDFLPGMRKKYEDKITLVMVDTSKSTGLSMFLRICEIYKHSRPVTPSILAGNTLLSGNAEIQAKFEMAVNSLLSGKITGLGMYNWQDFASMSTLMFFFQKIGVWTVAVTGLVDGVNPCSFAVIAFFVSLLLFYGYGRREIFFVGLAYCSAIFAAYLLMGVGAFDRIYHYLPFEALKHVFSYLVSSFCLVIFILMVYDFIKSRRPDGVSGAILQLPKFLRKNLYQANGDNLIDKKTRTGLSLMGTSFLIGFLVALLEGACTSQLYFPAAAIISESAKIHIKALGYLALYNVMFILPLVFIFALLLWVSTAQACIDFLKKHIGPAKIVMAIFFLVVGAMIFFL